MLTLIIAYCCIGFIAGSLSGLLGIGGGVIIVPSLAYMLKYQQLDPKHVMHMAAASSLAIIMLTSQASVRKHSQKIKINWQIYFSLLPGILFGLLSGFFVAQAVSSQILSICFAILLFFVGIQMLTGKHQEHHSTTLPNRLIMNSAGFLIGGKSGFLGIGGGAITIPFLNYCKVPMRQGIAISALVSLTVSSCSVVLNLIFADPLPYHWSTGSIYWPAVIAIAPASRFATQFGVHLSHRLNTETLRKVFGILLLCIAVDLFIYH